MAAGSVIAAMANNQNIDRMSGFRRALPFTSALLLIGCLALAAFPGTSGFFSKDEILAFAADRGGMYWIFAIGGYIGAAADRLLLVPDRLPGGRRAAVRGGAGARAGPHPPRRADQPAHRRGRGHRRRLPRAPSTTSPSASGRCGWRWRCSAFGALFAGLIQVPGVDHVRHHLPRRAPSRARRSSTIEPSIGDSWLGLAVGGSISIIGIARRLLLLRAPARGHRAAGRALPPPPRASCSTSGTSTSSSTRSSTGRRSRSGASPTRSSSASSSTGSSPARPAWSRAPARSSAAPSRASSAPTRCCWSAASPRSASTSWWCAN